ncbi:hypothetical protein ACSQ67_003285 [Phaseolus vulgaris]
MGFAKLSKGGDLRRLFNTRGTLFKKFGQPSLDLLRFHLASLPLTLSSLRLLTVGAKIPSSSDHLTSIKNINFTQTLVYDDGFLLVYDVDRFFDCGFPLMNERLISFDQIAIAFYSFHQAIQILKDGVSTDF